MLCNPERTQDIGAVHSETAGMSNLKELLARESPARVRTAHKSHAMLAEEPLQESLLERVCTNPSRQFADVRHGGSLATVTAVNRQSS